MSTGSRAAKLGVFYAVMLSLFAAFVVMSSSLYLTPEYEASIKILVGQKPQSDAHGIQLISTARPSGGPIQPLPNAETGVQTFTLIVARAVPTMPIARAVARRLNLPNGSAREVLENMSVEEDPGTMFIDVTYTDSEPKRAQLVANAIGQVVSQKIGEVSLGDKPITATLWQPAKLPSTPVSPHPLMNRLIALVATLTLSAGLIAVRAKAPLKAPLDSETREGLREPIKREVPRVLLIPPSTGSATAKAELKERFEAASLAFEAEALWKIHSARTGTRSYPTTEFYEDLYKVAGAHGLVPQALWAYFGPLHPPD